MQLVALSRAYHATLCVKFEHVCRCSLPNDSQCCDLQAHWLPIPTLLFLVQNWAREMIKLHTADNRDDFVEPISYLSLRRAASFVTSIMECRSQSNDRVKPKSSRIESHAEQDARGFVDWNSKIFDSSFCQSCVQHRQENSVDEAKAVVGVLDGIFTCLIDAEVHFIPAQQHNLFLTVRHNTAHTVGPVADVWQQFSSKWCGENTTEDGDSIDGCRTPTDIVTLSELPWCSDIAT